MKRLLFSFSVLLLSAGASFAQANNPSADTQAPGQPPSPQAAHKVDKAAAYYHYSLAHMYEEQVAVYGRSEMASKAIDEYRLAIEADPSSEYLTSGLAELYAKTGRIREAVTAGHDVAPYRIVLIRPGGLPKTTSGKIQRSQTRQMWLEGALPAL